MKALQTRPFEGLPVGHPVLQSDLTDRPSHLICDLIILFQLFTE